MVWKRVLLSKKIVNSPYTLQLIETLESEIALHDDVSNSSKKLLTMLFNGKPDDFQTNHIQNQTNHMRYVSYMHLIARSSTKPCPERLPPTERAAHFYILPVHLQVVYWKLLMAVDLDDENWGWKLKVVEMVLCSDSNRFETYTTRNVERYWL